VVLSGEMAVNVMIKKLTKDFPDPITYIIGFICHSAADFLP
jgi:hypothetical protein